MHTVVVHGKIDRFTNWQNKRHAVLTDSSSYMRFIIPDNNFSVGQDVVFEGTIVEVGGGNNYIRLAGDVVVPSEK